MVVEILQETCKSGKVQLVRSARKYVQHWLPTDTVSIYAESHSEPAVDSDKSIVHENLAIRRYEGSRAMPRKERNSTCGRRDTRE